MKKAGPFAELLAKMERSRAMIQKNCGKLGGKVRSKNIVKFKCVFVRNV